MQKIFLLICICFLISRNGFSQTNIIKVNPIFFAAGFFHATYEHALNSKSSLSLGMGFYAGNDGGFAATSEYRFYITHKNRPSPAGFYAGPNILLLNIVDDVETSIGALIGYQWVWKSGVSLDLGLGPQYSLVGDTFGNGVLPYGVFAIGYHW
ncbi:MAG: hypothetical protein WAS55_07455 [Saprospiraceae bacterium]